MRCIVCGGDHQPRADVCDPAGMDREAARMGAKRWNAITAQVMRLSLKKALEEIKNAPRI